MDEEEVHIAVGKNSRKEKANILWAAANFPRATIVLVHVHWPSKWMPFMGGKVLYKFADEKEKEMHRGREMKVMVNMLSQYKNLCGKRKVSAHYITHDDTVAGVVNLIKKLKIKRIVIGSRNMSRQVVVRQCCQVWLVLNGKHISTSNDHLDHSENIGYGGGSSGVLASIHELGEESDGYVTPRSDLVDGTMDEESTEMNDSDQLVTEDETLTEQGTEESITSEEMENFFGENADQSDEIQNFRNIADKAEKIMDFPKNRDLLAAFWNKLTVDDASKILSLTGVVIEGVTGSSVLTALSSWMCKPGYASLPVAYARAGSELLDLIQAKPSMHLSVSSDELFSLLDEASEKTFLCTNTAACIQKFLFDGEVEKIATELKNVVSCASYMLEQKLLEAWCADKTAEALRCQKLLEEEEEAAQKRQAELMERKRMKKLRQKEQRLKNLKDEDATVQSPEIMDDATCSTAIQSVNSVYDPDCFEQEESQYLQFPALITLETDNNFNVDLPVEDISCDLGPEMDKGVVLRQQVSMHHLGRTEKLAESSILSGSVVTSKDPALARPSNYKDPNVCSAPSRNKTCELKLRSEIEHCQKHELDVDERGMGPSKNSRVLIGSIIVAIEDGSEHSLDLSSKNDPVPPSSKTTKHASVKEVQQVIHEGNRNGVPDSDNRSRLSVTTDEISYSTCCDADLAVDEHLQCTMFSSKEATSFLSQRWKEAMAADHVKLVLCAEK